MATSVGDGVQSNLRMKKNKLIVIYALTTQSANAWARPGPNTFSTAAIALFAA
ncbi:MAG: hypothetical protein O2820_12380 [Planctomycetota bacterium]|nr:hypothetical protein [Planctomycetota bacterium]MDA1250009.1 hypothetical protein [Planctomycetota bacterium]